MLTATGKLPAIYTHFFFLILWAGDLFSAAPLCLELTARGLGASGLAAVSRCWGKAMGTQSLAQNCAATGPLKGPGSPIFSLHE